MWKRISLAIAIVSCMALPAVTSANSEGCSVVECNTGEHFFAGACMPAINNVATDCPNALVFEGGVLKAKFSTSDKAKIGSKVLVQSVPASREAEVTAVVNKYTTVSGSLRSQLPLTVKEGITSTEATNIKKEIEAAGGDAKTVTYRYTFNCNTGCNISQSSSVTSRSCNGILIKVDNNGDGDIDNGLDLDEDAVEDLTKATYEGARLDGEGRLCVPLTSIVNLNGTWNIWDENAEPKLLPLVHYTRGKVGIGISEPAEMLEVDGRIKTSGERSSVSVYNPEDSRANLTWGWWEDSVGTDIARLRIGGKGGSTSGATNGFAIQGTDDRLIIRGTNSGLIGIGTYNPEEKLHVAGGNLKISNLAGTGNSCMYIDSQGVLQRGDASCSQIGGFGDNLGDHRATQNIDTRGYTIINSVAGPGSVTVDDNFTARQRSGSCTKALRMNYSDGLTYSTGCSGGGATHFSIDGSKVGIGKSNPNYALDVQTGSGKGQIMSRFQGTGIVDIYGDGWVIASGKMLAQGFGSFYPVNKSVTFNDAAGSPVNTYETVSCDEPDDIVMDCFFTPSVFGGSGFADTTSGRINFGTTHFGSLTTSIPLGGSGISASFRVHPKHTNSGDWAWNPNSCSVQVETWNTTAVEDATVYVDLHCWSPDG